MPNKIKADAWYIYGSKRGQLWDASGIANAFGPRMSKRKLLWAGLIDDNSQWELVQNCRTFHGSKVIKTMVGSGKHSVASIGYYTDSGTLWFPIREVLRPHVKHGSLIECLWSMVFVGVFSITCKRSNMDILDPQHTISVEKCSGTISSLFSQAALHKMAKLDEWLGRPAAVVTIVAASAAKRRGYASCGVMRRHAGSKRLPRVVWSSW